jgi:hypothetical protein
MNNISICIACVCFIVVVVIAIQTAIMVVGMYNYVKDVVMSENNSVTGIIEKERFTTEYGGRGLLNVIHDNELNVTCWSKGGIGGISCIPDNQLNMS